MDEAVEGLNGTYVGKEAQLLAHGQESLLGTHFGVGVVVEARIANGREKNSVGILARLQGFFRERIADGVDGGCSAERFCESDLMTKLAANGFHHLDAFGRYFRADSVTGQNCYFQFHCFCVLRGRSVNGGIVADALLRCY